MQPNDRDGGNGMNETDRVRLQMRSELDQQMAASVQMATVMYGYFAKLIEQGFKPAQALELTGRFQDSVLGQRPKG